MNVKQMVAGVALLCASIAHAGNPVTPGGDLGNLNQFPGLFGASSTQDGFTPFAATYSFSLTAQSDVLGSVGSLTDFLGTPLAPIFFVGASIDGVDLLALPSAANSSGLTFGLQNVSIGSHTLTVAGIATVGATAFLGSIYAQQTVSQVPEPTTLALVLAGAGIVAGVGLRRRAAEALAA